MVSPGRAKGFLDGASVLDLSEETAPVEVQPHLGRLGLPLLRVRVRMWASGPEGAAEKEPLASLLRSPCPGLFPSGRDW